MKTKGDFLIYVTAIIACILMIGLLTTTNTISYNLPEEKSIINKATLDEINTETSNINFDKEIDIIIKSIMSEQEDIISSIANQRYIELKTVPPETTVTIIDKGNGERVISGEEKIRRELIHEIKKSITENDKDTTLNNTIISSKEKQPIIHTVKKGECLWNISLKYKTSVSTIISANNLKNPNSIRIGSQLKIPHVSRPTSSVQSSDTTAPPVTSTSITKYTSDIKNTKTVRGIWHYVYKGQTISEIARLYDTTISTIRMYNPNIKNINMVKYGTKLFIPGNKKIIEARLYKTQWSWPKTGKLTSVYGMRMHPIYKKMLFHNGIDISGEIGDSIRAANGGICIYSGWKKGYGKIVILAHENNYLSVYAHNSVNLVSKGQVVQQGDVIAKLGNTGVSTGPHVHFEVRKNNKPINPINFLK